MNKNKPTRSTRIKPLLLTFLLIKLGLVSYAGELQIFYNPTLPQVKFAVSEIEIALKKQGHDLKHFPLGLLPSKIKQNSIVLLLQTDKKPLERIQQAGANTSKVPQAEGFSLTTLKNNCLSVRAKDPAGLMYGALELAEQITVSGLHKIKSCHQNPYMAMRGTKFNIPLDVRTPSYTDVCDAAQQNIGEMWRFDFWKEYIDNLARYRYNYISLWNLHPFPSMVKVPDYPNIALDNVQRSTAKWEEFYPLEGRGFCPPEIINNVETLHQLTIDEKIAFWKKVMRYGKERNVDFYIITWNIFTYGTNGQYGITNDFRNQTTRDYFRKSVKQLLLTYPDLKGIGLTTGENMPGADFQQKEQWAYDTYAKGVLDAARLQPGRKITFVHRQHQTGALDIADKFKPIIEHPDIEFIYSFKYAKAHVYSSTTQNYHTNFVNDIKDRGDLKTIWTLRNDDVFQFRWGAPDFVREFIKNIPYNVSRGYYYGSDQYVWGREFLNKVPEQPRQIETTKHWYHWMLWGRLGYNPEMGNQRFKDLLATKYPAANSESLFNAWQKASMIYPITTGFHWGALDFQWYIESGQSIPGAAKTPSGFHDINRFISLPPHPTTDYLSIPKYVEAITNDKKTVGISPIQVAQQLHEYADYALATVKTMDATSHKELALVINDITTIAHMGKYYAHKIKAATAWHLFLKTSNKEHHQEVEKELNQAALCWRLFTSTATAVNKNPLWTNRVGHVDWRDQYRKGVLYDLVITGSEHHLPHMPQPTIGTILEAEESTFKKGQIQTTYKGYTGKGYVSDPDIMWQHSVKKEGWYVLEFRYSLKEWVNKLNVNVTINNSNSQLLKCYGTGSDNQWVWDRIIVKLPKGLNSIHLKGNNKFRIDHVNIFPFFY